MTLIDYLSVFKLSNKMKVFFLLFIEHKLVSSAQACFEKLFDAFSRMGVNFPTVFAAKFDFAVSQMYSILAFMVFPLFFISYNRE